MSLIKIPFLLSGAVAGYVIMTPPTAKVPVAQRAKEVSPFERIFSATVRLYTLSVKVLVVSSGILEALIIAANRFPSYPLSQRILDVLVAGPPYLVRQIRPSPLFIAGSIIGLLGGYIRWQCFRTLGRLFTFEVSIREGHKLITEGPYGWVRHPSYTGAILCLYGLGLTYVAPGSWLRECGILATQEGKIGVAVYVAALLFGTVAVLQRAPQEDKMLRKQFGEEWDIYAKRVPYRILPFIF